jgi:putative flippase GtrA
VPQKLLFKLYRQIWSFIWVGIAAFIVNASLAELIVLKLGPINAQLLAFPPAATVAWWLNRQYTFGSSDKKLHHEWLQYILANLLGWLLNNTVFLICVLQMDIASRHPSIAVAGGSLAGMLANFAMLRQLVFKKQNAD